MSKKVLTEYLPDTVTAPGFYIQEKLEELGMTQSDLAGRIGRTKKTINEIVAGKAPIEPETALQLERVLGIPARFWNNAERHYRDHMVRRDERIRLGQHVERLQQFPVKEMCKRGWLAKQSEEVEMLSELLSYFGVASFEALDRIELRTCAAFRQSNVRPVDSNALLAWLRKGELEARNVACRPFQKEKFRSALAEVRELTLKPVGEAIPKTVELCSECGVAVVFVPEFSGTRTWGATRWLTPNKAVIQLSARGKTDDQLWFTLFHEAGHILLHPKKEIFVEVDHLTDSREEEANRFAADHLIPPDTWTLLNRKRPRSHAKVQLFASQYNIAPGILVGRMQREKIIPWSHLNALKTHLQFKHS